MGRRDRGLPGPALAFAILLGLIVLLVGVWAVWVLILQWSWNTFAAPTLNVGTIDFLQALALSLLIAAIAGVGRRAVT